MDEKLLANRINDDDDKGEGSTYAPNIKELNKGAPRQAELNLPYAVEDDAKLALLHEVLNRAITISHRQERAYSQRVEELRPKQYEFLMDFTVYLCLGLIAVGTFTAFLAIINSLFPSHQIDFAKVEKMGDAVHRVINDKEKSKLVLDVISSVAPKAFEYDYSDFAILPLWCFLISSIIGGCMTYFMYYTKDASTLQNSIFYSKVLNTTIRELRRMMLGYLSPKELLDKYGEHRPVVWFPMEALSTEKEDASIKAHYKDAKGVDSNPFGKFEYVPHVGGNGCCSW